MKLIRIIILTSLLLFFSNSLVAAQEQANATNQQTAQEDPSWSEGELIELESIQIEGEIAQPNVTITVARQEPLFRELALERTPPEELTDPYFTTEESGLPTPAKIVNWSEMLERPRQ